MSPRVRNPNFSLARNYPQLQSSTADAPTQQAIQGAYQQIYDLRDAITYPTFLKVRTLDINDTTVGSDIAHPTMIHPAGNTMLIAGILRQTIAEPLVVRANISTPTSSNAVGIITFPANQPILTPVLLTTFTMSTLPDQGVLTWDILASDGSTSPDGVASVSIWWQ